MPYSKVWGQKLQYLCLIFRLTMGELPHMNNKPLPGNIFKCRDEENTPPSEFLIKSMQPRRTVIKHIKLIHIRGKICKGKVGLNICWYNMWRIIIQNKSKVDCAAGFALLNLTKGKSLGRSKPETNSSNEQALATHCVGFLLYPSSVELPYAK